MNQEIIKIETGRTYQANESGMWYHVHDAVILMQDEKYQIGTKFELFRSFNWKIIATKTSENLYEVKVQREYDARRYRKASCFASEIGKQVTRMIEEIRGF